MNTANQTKTRMLSEMLEVKELANTHDVNDHIKQGWKLIDTYQATSIHDQKIVKYCMGLPKSADSCYRQQSQTQHDMPNQKSYSNRKKFIYSL